MNETRGNLPPGHDAVPFLMARDFVFNWHRNITAYVALQELAHRGSARVCCLLC